MTATPPDWRVAVKKGDVLSVSGTYDSRAASWYESMAIMPVAMTRAGRRRRPVRRNVGGQGVLTHGHLPENDNHGGAPRPLTRRRQAPGRPAPAKVEIKGFAYGQGDLSCTGAPGRRPWSPGPGLTFVNDDAAPNIFHTITACRAPCTRRPASPSRWPTAPASSTPASSATGPPA